MLLELLSKIIFHYFLYICRGTEVAVGGSKVDIKCFANCGEEFNLTMIKVSIYFSLHLASVLTCNFYVFRVLLMTNCINV
jgi:hypothetical protein